MAADWSQLPSELTQAISEQLHIYADYVRFRGVCNNWKSSVPQTPTHLPPQLPWLMLPHSKPRRAFYDLSLSKFHFLDLPETSPSKRCRGSSHGWLVILAESPEILLFNPLTRARFFLPPLSSFPNVVDFKFANIGREFLLRDSRGERYSRDLRQMRDSFIKKVVLSSSPARDKESVIAVAILNHSSDLAYSRIGDNSWTIIEADSHCEDVVYLYGLFFAVHKSGVLAACDLSEEVAKVSIVHTTPIMFCGDLQYLVCSDDELFLVTRYLEVERGVYRTTRFEVFKLDLQVQKWEKIDDLGDKMFFVGENTSLSLSSSEFPGTTGNCIYYTDDYSEFNHYCAYGEHDLGIFKLCDGSIEPLPCYSSDPHTGFRWPSPIWVSPNPY